MKEIPSYPGFYITKCGRVFGPNKGNPLYERKRRLAKSSTKEYYKVSVHYKLRRLHRLLCETYVGPIPFPGAVVDHIDGNTLNNNINNLRWCTHRMNSLNRHGYSKGYEVVERKKGSTYKVKSTKWKGKLVRRGKTFDTAEKAHNYYLETLEMRRADAQKEFDEQVRKSGHQE